MAIHQHHHNNVIDQLEQNENVSSVLDALYCDEEKWEEEEVEQVVGELSEEETSDVTTNNDPNNTCSLFPLLLLEQDLFWEDEELNSLFSKEKIQHQNYYNDVNSDPFLSQPRHEAVKWMLKVNAHYGFSALTATLAVTYFDNFLLSFHFQSEKPWMIQLAAVTCISLAAKVEETQVPLLLDLQVQDAKFVFEAKTILKMELLVLSTLKWKMHPVTPLSFLDHIIRRLGLKTHLHWEFLRRCEHLLLSVLLDSRFVGVLPSVLATATMLHVIDQIEKSDGVEYKKQLLGVLKINKGKVDECYDAMLELTNANDYDDNKKLNKRKYEEIIPGSPSGVIDAAFNSDGSNDSWTVGSSLFSSSGPESPLFKKSRTQMKLSPLNRVIVGIVSTSP
ncbi:cyclin-D3-1-like [Lotus japonicus]|uniref:B-like cyclin n=1 Tax=Lotus japonicus TaxID=34305 RepID=I3SZW4_LOTJA|nr:cyclin-D3-1-like [Lotus japonicus]AFK45806.1 unknown [Lotus japonicus]